MYRGKTNSIDTMSRLVGILTDLYPPAFAPRIAYLTKYLVHFGWRVVVFTEQVEEHQIFDDFEEVCPVVRIALRAQNKVVNTAQIVGEILWEYKERCFTKAIERYISEHPEMKPDVLLCFTYRKFPLRTACVLAHQWRIPWIADCRDVIEQYSPGDWLPRRLRLGRFVLHRIENILANRYIHLRNKYIRSATQVSTVSCWHKRLLERIVSHPVELIYNGFDPELFYPKSLAQPSFVIRYTGRILSLDMRNPSLLFEAMSRPPLALLPITLELYTDAYSQGLLEPLVKQWGLEGRVYLRDMVSSRLVPDLLRSAGIILLLSNAEGEGRPQGMISTKLFEALALEKPLLLLPIAGGEVVEMLQCSGCGVATNSVEVVSAYIQKQYKKWQEHGRTMVEHPNRDFIARYSRLEQARQFANMLNLSINRYR